MVMKRQSSPTTWPIVRKGNKYIVTPKGDSASKSIPISIIIRDMLHYADNYREVRELLNNKMIKVDGKITLDHRYPINIMDIFTIGEDSYRLIPTRKGYKLTPLKASDSKKLLKIMNKKSLSKSKTQINFHDGGNIVVDKDVYKTGDAVIFDVKTNKIVDVVQCKRGALAIIIDGKNRGVIGKIEEIINVRGPQPNRILLKSGDKKIETLKSHIFVVGIDKPVIDIGDTSA